MKTLEYKGGALYLIDQTELPLSTKILECRDYRQVAEAIVHLRVRGAPAIGLAAAYGAVLAAQSLASAGAEGDSLVRGVEAAMDELAATRPTAVNLFWALDRMRAVLHATGPGPAERLIAELQAEADSMLAEDERANRRMGEFGAAFIPDGANVLTHCNAGALATGAFGTAVGVIVAAHESGKRMHVWVDETRPLLQGARLTAWELGEAGVPYTLITDNMAGHFMKEGRIDLAVVGADRIVANGDSANKIGTYSIATLARAHDIPFYFVAPTSTVDLGTPSGDRITIEERKPDEVTTFRGVRVAPEGAQVANPAFDVTPARLITAIITEMGVARPPFSEDLAAMVGEARSAPEPAIPVAVLEREG